MEKILSLYEEPYDEARPVVYFDESSKELREHKRDPLPAKPGAVARIDHHYARNGTRMLHLATEPLTGWCHLVVTERRRTCEWIDRMQTLADDYYPDAISIRVSSGQSEYAQSRRILFDSFRPRKHAPILIGLSSTTRPRTEVG